MSHFKKERKRKKEGKKEEKIEIDKQGTLASVTNQQGEKKGKDKSDKWKQRKKEKIIKNMPFGCCCIEKKDV